MLHYFYLFTLITYTPSLTVFTYLYMKTLTCVNHLYTYQLFLHDHIHLFIYSLITYTPLLNVLHVPIYMSPFIYLCKLFTHLYYF